MTVVMARASAILSVAVLSGCLTADLAVYSDPPGALISTLSGKQIGYAPTVVRYDWDSLQQFPSGNNCFNGIGLMAKWPSGATQQTPKRLRFCSGPNSYNLTIDRPSDVPGYEHDFEQGQRVMQSRQATQRHESEAERKMLGSILEGVSRGLDSRSEDKRAEREALRSYLYGQSLEDISGPIHQKPRSQTCTPVYGQTDLLTGKQIYECQ